MHLVRPAPEAVRARKREIARRYKEQAIRKGWRKAPLTFAAFRAAEIDRLIERRHGHQLPDTDDAVIYARVMLDHLAKLKNPDGRMRDWLTARAPWLTIRDRERLIGNATSHPLRYSADTIAEKLNVTKAERQALRLYTIGAVDFPKAERQAAAKERRRNWQRMRRQRRRLAKLQQGEATYISE